MHSVYVISYPSIAFIALCLYLKQPGRIFLHIIRIFPYPPVHFYPQFTSVTLLTNHETHHLVCSQSSTKIAEKKNRHRFSTRNYSITAVWKFKMESLMWMECSHCVRDMYLNDTIPLMEKSQMFYSFHPSILLYVLSFE